MIKNRRNFIWNDCLKSSEGEVIAFKGDGKIVACLNADEYKIQEFAILQGCDFIHLVGKNRFQARLNAVPWNVWAESHDLDPAMEKHGKLLNLTITTGAGDE